MQIGRAFYCDGCGVNIHSGTQCNECDPQHGSEQVVSTWIAYGAMVPGGKPSNDPPGLQLLLDPELIRQYEGLWGPYSPTGDYDLGDVVRDIVSSGEVLWRYQSDRGLVYIIDDHGWPAEILASKVITR